MLKRIGRYEVQRELGRGSCGRVYLAADPALGRLVAVKLIAQRDEHMLTRFRREAAAAAALNHPNIITIYEFGEDMGVPFIAMEYLNGELLSEIIDEARPAPIVEKARIMWQVAEGLRAAHEAGVVHRDVKPANLMVLPGGGVKIMDFGIARITGRSVTPITRKGDLLGTYMYMSPEQVHAPESADARSDIFSYGAVYYEYLTRQPPFWGNDVAELVEAIRNCDPPPVPALVPECPEALDAVIRQALCKDRRRRYHSLAELQLDARAALAELSHQRARELARTAEQAFAAGELERASRLVQEILELDPANTVARRLREAVRSRGRREARDLAEEGERELGRNRLSRAVELFRSALRLDGSNAAIQKKLRDTEARLAADREPEAAAPPRRTGAPRRLETAGEPAPPAEEPSAGELLDEADRLWRQQKLTQARRKAAAALEVEAANDRARKMLELIDRQIGRRRQRRLEAEQRAAEEEAAGPPSPGQQQAVQVTLVQVAALEKRGDLRGARMLLQAALQQWPGARELLEAGRRIEALLAAAPPRQPRPAPITDGLKQAQALIADRHFAEAQRLLRDLAAQAPGDRRVQFLLRELERQRS